ncbi:bifunctional nicotinamidase/pyrazinamidase [Alloacidobacterium sp.]|uniref:bifunctional nicotinamidase/pyrazinamidase n=1 Tax=Alloacidobacterium sp. TaxID=2951999 RepID=UPI002D5DEA94|nr:bifunctional nicotinamidase/pyrazinamidase [Alloacidobacterium sp.]HYK35550.1 bifunctional nicotinamidase/pyrazinamidase [Alloacidobacterium sp.]
MPLKITDRDALLIIDVQNDFCPGGALPVPHGDEVVPVINRLAPLFTCVVLTQDYHPAGHLSFASSHSGEKPFNTTRVIYGEQTLWPDHCIQGSEGAAFHRDLDTTSARLVLRKGFRREIDSYSAFQENDRVTKTGLAGYLRELGIERVFLAGLAYDYCVHYSAVDARGAGFKAVVIEDACRAIGLNNSVEAARSEFSSCGVEQITSCEFSLVVR